MAVIINKLRKGRGKWLEVGVIYEPKRPEDKPEIVAKFLRNGDANAFVKVLREFPAIAEIHLI